MTRQEHLLAILSEECHEVGQRAIKALRFGINEMQRGQSLDNSVRITYELNDLLAVVKMLTDEGYIPKTGEEYAIKAKKEKVEKYLKYCKEIGTLK